MMQREMPISRELKYLIMQQLEDGFSDVRLYVAFSSERTD